MFDCYNSDLPKIKLQNHLTNAKGQHVGADKMVCSICRIYSVPVISSASEIVTSDREQFIQPSFWARFVQLRAFWSWLLSGGESARQLLGYTWLSNLFGIPGEFAYLDLTGAWNRAQHHRLQNPMSICVVDE